MHRHEDDLDAEELVAERLVASRPHPDPGFVEALEQRLFPPPDRARHSGWPARSRAPLVAAVAVFGVAVALLVAGLAGGGPLASGGSSGAGAASPCRLVTTTSLGRVPVITPAARGGLQLRYERARVRRQVERCR